MKPSRNKICKKTGMPKSSNNGLIEPKSRRVPRRPHRRSDNYKRIIEVQAPPHSTRKKYRKRKSQL